MRRLRLIADVANTASVVPGDDRSERRARSATATAEMHPLVFGLMLGRFAGPEAVAADLAQQDGVMGDLTARDGAELTDRELGLRSPGSVSSARSVGTST